MIDHQQKERNRIDFWKHLRTRKDMFGWVISGDKNQF